jgi:hypothetical protein
MATRVTRYCDQNAATENNDNSRSAATDLVGRKLKKALSGRRALHDSIIGQIIKKTYAAISNPLL